MGSYSTTFPTVENPVSVGGGLITSTSPGVNWSGLSLGRPAGGTGRRPIRVKPESVDYANSNYADALAVATGTWAPDQSASITVGNIAANYSSSVSWSTRSICVPTPLPVPVTRSPGAITTTIS